jgi:hypothetical protein
MNEENKQELLPETVTYIILLSAMQVVLNCALELQGTIYDQGKVKQKIREAINQMVNQNSKNRDRIWVADEKKAADLMYAIQKIGEQVAKGDGLALMLITKLSREGFDLAKCVITELSDEELEKRRAEL